MSTREQWMRRLGPFYGGAVALVGSTPWRWPVEVGDEARSSGWIVAVGAPIGLAAWVVAALAHGAGIAGAASALLGLGMLSLASAALVERGLAERLGVAAGGDQRYGAGTVALVFFTLIRAAAIVALPPSRWLGVLIATAMVGRWAAVFLQALGDPIAGDDAPPRSLVATPTPAWLTAALSLGVAIVAVLALGKAGIAALALTAACVFLLGIDAQRRDQGLSAPVVACAAAIGEVVVLLIATIGA